MTMLKKAYVEITNRCNLSCSFCPKTHRTPRDLSPEEFACILDRLRGSVEYVYLHVMGEPLLHPQLARLLALADERGIRICITTNGTLLPAREETLLAAQNLHKVSVSLHSFEANGGTAEEQKAYLDGVWHFADRAARQGVFCALRLWNEGGAEAMNTDICAFLREKIGTAQWSERRDGSFFLRDHLYLERARIFDWPELSAPPSHTQFCYALRDQIGVLSDGTVVPCCLDHEGSIALGNLLTEELDEILHRPRARQIVDGFSRRAPSEELCRRCGFAARFNR